MAYIEKVSGILYELGKPSPVKRNPNKFGCNVGILLADGTRKQAWLPMEKLDSGEDTGFRSEVQDVEGYDEKLAKPYWLEPKDYQGQAKTPHLLNWEATYAKRQA